MQTWTVGMSHSAVDHHPLLHSCIYNSTLWIIADFAAALWYMLAMLVLLYILRDVRRKRPRRPWLRTAAQRSSILMAD